MAKATKKEESFPLAKATKKAEPVQEEKKTPIQVAKKATPVKEKKNLFEDEEDDAIFSKPAKKKESPTKK